MKRKRVIVAIGVVGVAIVIGNLLMAPAAAPPRPMTVSFVGFTNALPFAGAPEEVRGLNAEFQVTNHLARSMTYHCVAHGSQAGVRARGSSVAHASYEIPAHGSGTFMLSTDSGTNEWTFVVVTSSSRPRPAWQHRIRGFSKWLGGPRVFLGPAKTYPPYTNTWKTP